MCKYYWQGNKSFPEDAGELTFTPVRFDSETESLVIVESHSGDAVEEYLIDGIDEMWIVCEKFRVATTPVPLTTLSELDTATNSYKIADDKTLAKVRRFAKNKDTLAEMEKLTRRTNY